MLNLILFLFSVHLTDLDDRHQDLEVIDTSSISALECVKLNFQVPTCLQVSIHNFLYSLALDYTSPYRIPQEPLPILALGHSF